MLTRYLKQWWPVWAYFTVTIVCSCIYWLVPSGMFPYVLDYWEALYFSLVTGTTLGYGDIAPTHIFTRVVAAAQALSSPIFLAFFVSKSLYQKQIKDTEAYRKDQAQLLYGQLYSYLDRFLNEIETSRRVEPVTLHFVSSDDRISVISENYDSERSGLALSNTTRLYMQYQLTEKAAVLEILKSRLPTIYKPALLELARNIIRFSSVDSILPTSVTLKVGAIFRMANDLESDIGKMMPEMPEGYIEGDLQDHWKTDNLRRLKWIEVNIYELLAQIEVNTSVVVDENVDWSNSSGL